MKKLAILSLVLLPAAALGADEGTERTAVANDPDRLVCRNVTQIGTRLARRRVCLTEAQWDEQRRINRADMENRQTRNCLGRCAE